MIHVLPAITPDLLRKSLRLTQKLEQHAQRHLDLPRAADGFVGDAQAAQARALIQRGEAGVARLCRSGLPGVGEAVEVDVLIDVVDREIEAGGVGQVEHIEGVAHRDSVVHLGHFHERNVGAALPGLAENIALAAGDEVGFVRVVRRNGAVERAGSEQRQRNNRP